MRGSESRGTAETMTGSAVTSLAKNPKFEIHPNWQPVRHVYSWDDSLPWLNQWQ